MNKLLAVFERADSELVPASEPGRVETADCTQARDEGLAHEHTITQQPIPGCYCCRLC
jgi:hypothetical protein